jgi:hypothetical protein
MNFANIMIFGDPAIDTRFIVELLGGSHVDPLRSVFETNVYDIDRAHQDYSLYHIAGIPSSRTDRSSLQARMVLKNLPKLSWINLLIYVVHTDKPTSNNFRFFYDYLCKQDAPIILVQTTHTHSELSWFDLVLTLDGADPESDKVNLRNAVTKHLNRKPRYFMYDERFNWAAGACWKLLGKEAGWSFEDFRDALKLTCKKADWLSERAADPICERIIEHDQMSLKKQSTIQQVSVGDDIQQRVDAILSTIIAVGNVTPIPFLSEAAESLQNIGETVQVCATTTHLRS